MRSSVDDLRPRSRLVEISLNIRHQDLGAAAAFQNLLLYSCHVLGHAWHCQRRGRREFSPWHLLCSSGNKLPPADAPVRRSSVCYATKVAQHVLAETEAMLWHDRGTRGALEAAAVDPAAVSGLAAQHCRASGEPAAPPADVPEAFPTEQARSSVQKPGEQAQTLARKPNSTELPKQPSRTSPQSAAAAGRSLLTVDVLAGKPPEQLPLSMQKPHDSEQAERPETASGSTQAHPAAPAHRSPFFLPPPAAKPFCFSPPDPAAGDRRSPPSLPASPAESRPLLLDRARSDTAKQSVGTPPWGAAPSAPIDDPPAEEESRLAASVGEFCTAHLWGFRGSGGTTGPIGSGLGGTASVGSDAGGAVSTRAAAGTAQSKAPPSEEQEAAAESRPPHRTSSEGDHCVLRRNVPRYCSTWKRVRSEYSSEASI